MKIIRAVSVLLIVLQALACQAQDDVITGFSGNGFMTWTNSHSNGQFTVEWASYPEGPWQSNWTGLWNLAATADTISASVPMFYRVHWSTNETHDLQVSPSEATIAIDGNLVILNVAGGDGSYEWSVFDIVLGNISGVTTGKSVLYQRGNQGDNAVIVQSDGRSAYAVIHQP